MTDHELASVAESLVDKGVTSDIGDTDYLYDATEEDIDRCWELIHELKSDGSKAFRKKYFGND